MSFCQFKCSHGRIFDYEEFKKDGEPGVFYDLIPVEPEPNAGKWGCSKCQELALAHKERRYHRIDKKE